MDEPNEASVKRTPQPRWVGFVIIVVVAVLAVTVWPTVRQRIERSAGV